MSGQSNLKNIAAKGLFWSGLERFGSQGIQLIFGIFITRLLAPEDYGLLGMILIFIIVGQTLVDSGFGSALIFKNNPTQKDYSTVFIFSVLIGLLLYLVLFLISPLVADFYDEPKLTSFIKVSGLNLIIISLSVIQQVILQKEFNFKTLAIVNNIGSLFAGILSVYLAKSGFGTWALIAQLLIKNLFTTVSLWIFCKWTPLLVFNLTSLKELFNYGSKLTVAGLVYYIFQNIYLNIIGKLFPVATLGFYTRAVQLQEFPVKTVTSIFQRVTFPVFSSINNEDDRLKNAVRKTIRTLAFITYPVIFGLIGISDELILVLFTDKWMPASEFFKLLCLIGFFYFFLVINGEVLKAKGKSGWLMNMEIITKSILIINIFITYRWGVSAIILGQLLSVVIAYLLGCYFVTKLIQYKINEQLKDISSYFLLSLVMYVCIFLIGYFNLAPVFLLTLRIVFGVLFYVSFSLLFKFPEAIELKKWLLISLTKEINKFLIYRFKDLTKFFKIDDEIRHKQTK